MLRVLTWPSDEASPRLTPDEVNTLVGFTFQLAQTGALSNGKYVGATEAIYWQRMKGGN